MKSYSSHEAIKLLIGMAAYALCLMLYDTEEHEKDISVVSNVMTV